MFPSKVVYAEGYTPSKRIRNEYVDYFEDKEIKNIPAEGPDELPRQKPEKSAASPEKTSLKDFAKTLNFKRDDEGEVWIGEIVLDSWEDFIENPDSRLEVVLTPYENGQEEIPKEVIKSLRFTYEKQAELKKVILKAFMKMLRSEEWSNSDFMEEMGIDEIESVDDLPGLISLEAIMITIPPDDRKPKVGYYFASEELDPAHGIGVLLQSGKVLDIGISDIVYSVDYDE